MFKKTMAMALAGLMLTSMAGTTALTAKAENDDVMELTMYFPASVGGGPDALIDALESGHLAGAGLDVVDGDRNIYYSDHKNQMLHHHQMAILNSMPNVLMLPHMAYYTDQALEDMVRNSLAVTSEYFLTHQ